MDSPYTYEYRGQHFSDLDGAGADSLKAAHGAGQRVWCECTRPPQSMYVALVATTYIAKRMPNTGHLHASDCRHYEPPPALTGRGELMGSAILENSDANTIALKFNFSLSQQAGKAPAASDGANEAGSVKHDPHKLSMLAVLHYLWDEAGFNRWMPAFANKRSWHFVHHYLRGARDGKTSKRGPLAELLYIPEPYQSEHKDALRQRRARELFPLARPGGSKAKPLMLVIGEVKTFEAARYGFKMIVKHLPDFPFMVDADLHKRLHRRFADALALTDAIPSSHLIVIASFRLGATGIASLVEAALMAVNPQWIPVESMDEHQLLETLIEQERSFTKGMRYNLSGTRPMASVVLSDTRPGPVAMFILPSDAKTLYYEALKDLLDHVLMPAWYWLLGRETMPALPPANQPYAGMTYADVAAKVAVDQEANTDPSDEEA